jgi:hypothetical protein
VQWTDGEAEFYAAFDRWQRIRALRRGLPVGFVTQMPLRLASTCLPAARDRVLAGSPADWQQHDDMDATGDDGDADTWDESDVPPPEVVELAARLGNVDSKFDAFIKALEPIVAEGKRVLVFTFSRAALAYLLSRLTGRVRVDVLHGDVKKEERHRVMAAFRSHEFDVLLASRVASEGLDFEFCSAVVNYDLPWNPMEVEQRIGRIDRFGQAEDKVLVLNFHTPGTIESDIIERVHRRIGVFTDSIGELEPILQSHLGELRRTMFDFSLSEEQRSKRLEETMTAIEEQRLTRADVESAASYLSSTDNAEIDGLERDLTSQGRYVGQGELVRLIDDWALTAGGDPVEVSSDGGRVLVRGNAAMENHLHGVQAAGERSGAELAALARSLRNETQIVLALEPELARTTGSDLLSATHPLVRAALRVPGASQARFAHLSITTEAAPSGRYLVLVAISRWIGLRTSIEFWTSAVSLDDAAAAPEHVGLGVLAALAEGQLGASEVSVNGDALEAAVRMAQRQLRRRQAETEERYVAENQALVDTRRISLRETHDRKVDVIERRIATLQSKGNSSVIHLQEAQLRNQERLLREAESRLDAAMTGSLDLEHVAACVVSVVSK